MPTEPALDRDPIISPYSQDGTFRRPYEKSTLAPGQSAIEKMPDHAMHHNLNHLVLCTINLISNIP